MKEDLNSQKSKTIENNFEIAVKLVKSLPQKGSFQPSYAEAAKIYSYFKQSKFGKCNIPKPGFWDYINRAKWDAWSALGDMPQLDAMENYVHEIKTMYLRIKNFDEFKEKEHEYADILIPFCKANDIEMSETLTEILFKHPEKTKGIIDNYAPAVSDVPSSKINGKVNKTCVVIGGLLGTDDRSNDDENTDDSAQSLLDNEVSDHSTLLESATKLQHPKVVSFKLNGNNGKVIVSDEENDDDEDEIFCDTIDPENMENGQIDNSIDSRFINGHNDESVTSTPPSKNSTDNDNSSPGTSDSFEILQKQQPENRFKPFSEASFVNQLTNPIRKPTKNKGPKKRNGMQYKHRSQKNIDESKRGSSNNQPLPKKGSSTAPELSESMEKTFTSNSLPTNSSGGSDDNDDDDCEDSFSSTSSMSNDTIGLKIVSSLERMEENMIHVLERLDSIDNTIRTLTKPPKPWWKYLPSKSILIWAAWPVLVNLIFFLYWKKKSKRGMK